MDLKNPAASAALICALSVATPIYAQCIARPPDAGFAKTNLTFSVGEARTGSPVTVSWSLPQVAKSASKPAYLMVLLPDASRVDGTGFFALAAGAPNPIGIKYGQNRTRAIAPLHTAFSDSAGEIQVLPYLAGQLTLEWAVVGTDACGEWIAAQGKSEPLAIGGGAPQIVLRDEFSSQQPERILRALKGPYKIHVFKDRFEVYDETNGTLVLRRQGREPTFSPTGRFLTLKTSIGETYEVVDLVAGRVIDRYEINSLSWSHADSFLYYEDTTVARMRVVRLLHGLRHEPNIIPKTPGELARERLAAGGKDEEPEDRKPQEPSIDIQPFGTACARGCYARELWTLDLSISTGLVVFEDQFHDQAPQILIYDLAGKKQSALFDRGPAGRIAFKEKFGIEMPQLVPVDKAAQMAFKAKFKTETSLADSWKLNDVGWRVGDTIQTTTVAYPEDGDQKFLAKTGRVLPTRTVDSKRPADKNRKVARRGVISADPVDTSSTASKRVIGANLNHLPSMAVKELRAGRDTTALRGIEREIAPLYPKRLAEFGVQGVAGSYGRAPFPNPQDAPPKERIAINLADAGRDLWRWTFNGATYWLTQTVDSDHIMHRFRFSMVAKEVNGELRHANLVVAGNESKGVRWTPTAKSSHNDKSGDDSKSDDDDDDWWYLQYGVSNAQQFGPYSQNAMGDFRTDLDKAFGAPSVVTISGERYLAVVSKPIPRLMIFDLQEWRFTCGVLNPIDGADAVSAVVHSGGQHVTQVNSDGAIHVYTCPNGENMLNGAYVDDELVVLDRNGYFEGSDDAQGYVEVAIPGLPGRHLLSQFANVLGRPGIAAEVLAGRSPAVAPTIKMPPLLRRAGGVGNDSRLDAFSESGLSYVQFYEDGRALPRINVSGTSATVSLPGKQNKALTAIAVDQAGLVSAPLRVMQPNARPKKSGQLLALAVGIDKYPAMPGANLRFAVADARRVTGAMTRSPLYEKSSQTVLIDEAAREEAISGAVDRMIADAKSDDTILLFFAGHGLIDRQGQLRLALSSTALDKLETTTLSFDALSAKLRHSKARVVVLLDVCHAGLSDRAAIATNDAAVARLITDSGASMIVLSASKGRQFSEETAASAGGRFSLALEHIITAGRKTYDTNANGVIGVEELYRGLKAMVVRETSGRQTPWLSRNLMVGDFDLF